MEIYFFRHGESLGNVEKRLQTHDEPLTEKGIIQSKELKNKTDDIDFDVVFSSDMQRCVDTTKIIFSNKELPIFYLKNLEEKRNGDYEGLITKDIDWTEINKQPFMDRRVPNGETLNEVKERVNNFLDLLKHLQYEKVAVVSHGTIIRVLLAIVQDIDIQEYIMNYQLNNCSITKINLKNDLFSVFTDK